MDDRREFSVREKKREGKGEKQSGHMAWALYSSFSEGTSVCGYILTKYNRNRAGVVSPNQAVNQKQIDSIVCSLGLPVRIQFLQVMGRYFKFALVLSGLNEVDR